MGWKGLANGFRCTEEVGRGRGRDTAEGGDFLHKPRELTSLLITRPISTPVKLVGGEKIGGETAPSLLRRCRVSCSPDPKYDSVIPRREN